MGSSKSWNETGKKGNHRQTQSGPTKCDRICRRDSVERALQQPGTSKAADKADRNSNADKAHPALEHQSDDTFLVSPQGQPDIDLMPPLPDKADQQAVKSNRR